MIKVSEAEETKVVSTSSWSTLKSKALHKTRKIRCNRFFFQIFLDSSSTRRVEQVFVPPQFLTKFSSIVFFSNFEGGQEEEEGGGM